MTQMFRTLKFRLMLLITFMLLLVVALPVSLFIYHLDKNYQEFSTNMLEATTGMAYQYVFEGMMQNDRVEIQKNIELLALEPRINLMRIYDTTGTIVYSSKIDEIQTKVSFPNGLAGFDQGGVELESFEQIGNDFVHRHPIYVQQECTGCHVDRGSVIGIMDLHAGFIDSYQIYASTKKLSIVGAVLIIVILWILTNILYQSQIESRLLTVIAGFERLAKGDFKH